MKISFKDCQEAQTTQKEYKEGIYQVRITNVSDGVWQQAKSEYLEVEFETMGAEQFKVRHRFTKSAKALSILLNFLGAVGIYDKNSKEDIEFENNDLLGAILKIELVKGAANSEGKQYLELKPWTCEAVSGVARVEKPKAEDVVIGGEDTDSIPF